MKYYWIWSIVWTVSAFVGGYAGDLKKTIYISSTIFVVSFIMWLICYMTHLREKR